MWIGHDLERDQGRKCCREKGISSAWSSGEMIGSQHYLLPAVTCYSAIALCLKVGKEIPCPIQSPNWNTIDSGLEHAMNFKGRSLFTLESER
jgi:hypothetical protein